MKSNMRMGLPRETPEIVCADDRVRVEWMHREVHMGKYYKNPCDFMIMKNVRIRRRSNFNRFIIMFLCLFMVFAIVSCGGKKDSEVPANESTNESSSKWGYIDKTGDIVIDAVFDDAWGFSEGLALIKIDGKYGYIDKSGSIAIEPRDYASAEVDEEELAFSEGMAVIP